MSNNSYENIVERTLFELQANIDNAQNDTEKRYYQNRYDVQLADFAKATGLSTEAIEEGMK